MDDNKSDRRTRVLVVEDIDWIRAGMKKELEARGYLVLEAADAKEALALTERSHPDLVLTEEELPTLNQLVDQIREHPELSRVPTVIVNPDAEEGARLGDIFLLTDYKSIERLLSTHPR